MSTDREQRKDKFCVKASLTETREDQDKHRGKVHLKIQEESSISEAR